MNFKFLIAAFGLLMAANTTAIAGDAAAGQTKMIEGGCVGCHMMDGNSVVDQFPKIAGQHEQYIIKQLNEFKTMVRKNDLMFGMAAALTDEDMANLAAFLSTQTATASPADESLVALGKDIYRGGNSSTGVPACMACHGPNGSGNPTAKYPALAGQFPAYTATQLKTFRDGTRNNDMNNMMRSVAVRMTDAEIDAVANYIASMK